MLFKNSWKSIQKNKSTAVPVPMIMMALMSNVKDKCLSLLYVFWEKFLSSIHCKSSAAESVAFFHTFFFAPFHFLHSFAIFCLNLIWFLHRHPLLCAIIFLSFCCRVFAVVLQLWRWWRCDVKEWTTNNYVRGWYNSEWRANNNFNKKYYWPTLMYKHICWM